VPLPPENPTNGDPPLDDEPAPLTDKVRRALVGSPRDFTEPSIFHKLSLIPILAWVGLGADGLSSSCYGPEDAFRALGHHTYLAVGLAVLMAFTVFLISLAYSRIIEEFPHGGGGYVVATKTLGERAGVISGCALLVDYVLTITVSIAGAGNALFSLLPEEMRAESALLQSPKLTLEVVFICVLTVLNLRGVRESVKVLAPVFFTFLLTHLVLIAGGFIGHVDKLPDTAREVTTGWKEGLSTLGLGGMAVLFFRAYSLGGGTYTGIEAVSNGVPIMREPRTKTAKRTMLYMAISLAFTAAGILVCYLLWDVGPVEGQTMNAVLAKTMSAGIPGGTAFVWVTLVSEALLLVVAAQAGFIDGPRVMATMAVDSWFPHRFSALSDRLTTQNGVLLMGGAALAALLYTGGNIHALVIMYSINVFLTFSFSMFGMARQWFSTRREKKHWKRRTGLFISGFLLCATILVVTVFEKFAEGGWLTLAVTSALIALCFYFRYHYRSLALRLAKLYSALKEIPPDPTAKKCELNPKAPTAVVLVSGYGGAGIHTTLSVFRVFPGQFKNLVFLSVGVLDSGVFKGEEEIEALRQQTRHTLERYAALAESQGIPATWRMSLGTDVVEEVTRLCVKTAEEFPRATFFAGKVLFEHEGWIHRLLHNESAVAVQSRLHWKGYTMVILPVRVDGRISSTA
jgi:amino acid transporter